MYSLVGPMGETVSPQRREDSPWIDEVWHSVNSDPTRSSFMIHGAGSYQSDFSYEADKGIPVQDIPFYSPSLGKYCHDEDGECGFVAWVSSIITLHLLLLFNVKVLMLTFSIGISNLSLNMDLLVLIGKVL